MWFEENLLLTARRKFCVWKRERDEGREGSSLLRIASSSCKIFPFITVYLWLGACIAQAEQSRTAFDVFPISLSTQRERKRRLNLADLLNNIELEIISKLKWEWKLELIPFTPPPLYFISIRWVRAESFINERDNDNNNNMQCTSPWYVSFHCTLTLSTGLLFMLLLLLHRTSCCCLLCSHFTEAAAREAGWVRERVRKREGEQVQKTNETGRESACLLRFWFRCRPYQSREYYIYV